MESRVLFAVQPRHNAKSADCFRINVPYRLTNCKILRVSRITDGSFVICDIKLNSKARTLDTDKSLGKIREENIEQLIFQMRGQKVILSPHLAELYGVETRVLVQAVKRNIDRFPDDFMFQLSDEEFTNLKSQIVISSWGGSRRAKPHAFTEQGVAMLSSVLRSKRAVQVNIEIMRTFVKLRQMLSAHKDLENKLAALEKKYDEQFKVVFDAIRRLSLPVSPRKRRPIGFKAGAPKKA